MPPALHQYKDYTTESDSHLWLTSSKEPAHDECCPCGRSDLQQHADDGSYTSDEKTPSASEMCPDETRAKARYHCSSKVDQSNGILCASRDVQRLRLSIIVSEILQKALECQSTGKSVEFPKEIITFSWP
jgi:hypothetical protein